MADAAHALDLARIRFQLIRSTFLELWNYLKRT
uniref:Uncharacterized protein n=1 Tax=Fusarium oxysporum (strain Fo5176) TaxID=660025 RepID=A0A0D2XQQ9_FUSOF